jgi:PEP-CTERM motif-containing protein
VNLGPGTTTLFVFGAPGENSDPTGKASLGPFFNGNNSTPGAVGVNSTNSSGTGVGAASTANTFDLSPTGLASATNPHSLSFVDGSSTARLTSFDWRSTSLKRDLVSPFDNRQNQSLDFFGSFTVEVSPAMEAVPEPATLLLLGSTFAGAGLAGWRRRRKSQPS